MKSIYVVMTILLMIGLSNATQQYTIERCGNFTNHNVTEIHGVREQTFNVLNETCVLVNKAAITGNETVLSITNKTARKTLIETKINGTVLPKTPHLVGHAFLLE